MTAPDGQRHHGWWRIEEVDGDTATEKTLEMGAEQGMTEALGQIDGLLATEG